MPSGQWRSIPHILPISRRWCCCAIFATGSERGLLRACATGCGNAEMMGKDLIMDMPQFKTSLTLFDELCGEHVLVRPYPLADIDAVYVATEASRDHLRPFMLIADA